MDAILDEQINEDKLWLFQENIRLRDERQSLKEERDAFNREISEMKLKIKEESRRIEYRQCQLDREKKLLDDKWKALKRGFDELAEDRKALKHLEDRLLEQKRAQDISMARAVTSGTDMFFRGVSDTLSLKKRYKDLLKIFHPDNVAGDNDTVLSITKEYDRLKLTFK